MAVDLRRALDVTTSFGASMARLGSGMSVGATGKRPAEPLALYEFEACPYCRKVREVLSVLDLDAMVYPCPKDGPRYREEVRRRGGKAQFPYLVDPNSGQAMYESDDIVRYLCTTYGDGTVPRLLGLGPVTDATAMLASVTVSMAEDSNGSRSEILLVSLAVVSASLGMSCECAGSSSTSSKVSAGEPNLASSVMSLQMLVAWRCWSADFHPS